MHSISKRVIERSAGRGDGIEATVCICAHNEASVLADAVESAMAQRISADRYEVLVVDSASSPGSYNALRAITEKWGERLRWVREELPGLSRARNRGLAEARGAITAFIDADALAEPDWLTRVLEAFARDAKAGAVGGPVHVRWEVARPTWWRRELDEVFNFYQPGEALMKLTYPRYPYGTNLAVRTAAALELGGFCESLGRRKRTLLAGEDGEMCLRLERAGLDVLYVPGAVVQHRTKAERLTRRFVLRRAFRHGRSQRVIERMHEFDSQLYPSWLKLLLMIVGRVLTLRCDLLFMKFAAFRLGYRWEGIKGQQVNKSTWRSVVGFSERRPRRA